VNEKNYSFMVHFLDKSKHLHYLKSNGKVFALYVKWNKQLIFQKRYPNN